MEPQSTSQEFIALLSFFTTEQGGLKTPALSGDRIKLQFEYSHTNPFAEIEFLDDETVYPGDTAKAKLIITSHDFKTETIAVGTAFSFSLGEKAIGDGVIKSLT
jgi:translation elongation factor EF-Tu-like GTPase